MKKLSALLVLLACVSGVLRAEDKKPVLPSGIMTIFGFPCVLFYVRGLPDAAGCSAFSLGVTEDGIREYARNFLFDAANKLPPDQVSLYPLLIEASQHIAFPEWGDAVTDSTLATFVCGSSLEFRKEGDIFLPPISDPKSTRGGCVDAMVGKVKGFPGPKDQSGPNTPTASR